MWRKVMVVLLGILGTSVEARSQRPELNTALMESTFKIQGIARGNPAGTVVGTVFFIGRPSKSDPSRSYFVLITARHVLDAMEDDATILLREKQPDGSFRKFPHTFKIRENGKDLYVHHDQADVAAMYFRMPIKDPFMMLDKDFLADDDKLKLYEMHPGDELLCLGFPLAAEANEIGFPILRSGRIASYPLIPTKTVKSFLYDFRVFDGNSGGPVYFTYDTRTFGGNLHSGGIMGIVGLVSQQNYSAIPGHFGQPLDLGVIVPAVFIVETINMLPEKQQ
jgi:hypothetical protein